METPAQLMELMAHLRPLLAELPEDPEDEIGGKLLDLETHLTISDLLLLVKAAVLDGENPWEPIWPYMVEMGADGKHRDPEYPLRAAVRLPEETLRRLTGQQQLVRQGLLWWRETPEHGLELALTPLGARAVEWFVGCLMDDLGIQMPEALTTAD